MHRSLNLKSLAVIVFVACGNLAPASAAITNVTLYPSYSGAFNVAGNGADAAPGFSSSSWQQSSNVKGELYIPASSLFASPVTIQSIASISYWTNKSTTTADPDWSLMLYTAATGVMDSASWYHSRLNAEPYLTGTPAVTPGIWHQWSTNDALNPLRFYDANRNGGIFGTYTDPTLTDLQAGAVTWQNNAVVDYSQEPINLFSLQTGSAWANGFTGLVDGLTITLVNGDVANVNLEAVPEPASIIVWSLIGLAFGGVAWRRRRKHDA